MNIKYTIMNVKINLQYTSLHSLKWTEAASSSSMGVHYDFKDAVYTFSNSLEVSNKLVHLICYVYSD